MHALELDRLTVRYKQFTAVDQLSLTLAPGELFGLLGPNGAGKSSTIRVLTGQRPASGGSVRILGHDLVREWDAIKPLFGFVPDRENHFEEFTGRENLRFFAELYSVEPQRIDECLAAVELAEAGDLPVNGYSLGMRRKLLLARALLHRPKVMYLDEPTANLDIHSTRVVWKILRQLVQDGATILLTTHNMKEVETICDRVAILCRGKLVALDSPIALQRQHHVRMADATLLSGERWELRLDDEADRERLAGAVRSGQIDAMRTREFDFHAAFLRLTGTEFD